MPDVAGLALSVALPWLAGMLAVLALCRGGGVAVVLRSAGYGYLLGAFAATLILRGLSAAAIRWNLAVIALPTLALVVACVALARAHIAPRALRAHAAAAADALRAQDGALRAVFWIALVLIAARLAGLALEVAWRPLLPWDAWSQWATKSRVWYEFGRLVPFVSQRAWLAGGDPMQFVDMHPHYPATVPLLQVWTDLWLGHWDESLMNAPWVAIAVALGLAFYAQLRRAGLRAAKAMVFTYVLLSLPYLDIHVALAGIADLFIAAAYGLAAIALWQWARTRERCDLALALACGLICPALKVEGLLWALTLVPGALVAVHRRAGIALAGLLGLAALAWVLFGPAEIELLGYVLRSRFTNVTLPLAQHLFVMDNWHLLWYATLGIVTLRVRRLLARDLAPMTLTMAGAVGLVFVVYYFSSAAGGVDDESLVNRMPLQMIAALVFYLALLLQPAPAQAAGETRRSTQLQAYAAEA
jgi:hypothetical protein